jgi:hypothetical protein
MTISGSGGVNRPETVLELARKFSEASAAQEIERHRSERFKKCNVFT